MWLRIEFYTYFTFFKTLKSFWYNLYVHILSIYFVVDCDRRHKIFLILWSLVMQTQHNMHLNISDTNVYIL
jgi:hypothetical protein